MAGEFRRSPPKGALINLDTSERFDFQFNPETFTETIGVNYAKHSVPGLSWEIMNYINTKNNVIPLSLYMSELLADEEHIPINTGVMFSNRVLNAKAFLEALVYPIDQPAGGWVAPPQVLFIWPSVIRMFAVVTNLSFTHQRFSERNLATIALTADLTLEECRTIQRFSASVRQEGSEFAVRSRG